MKKIDLRSDTLTRPTPTMWAAMCRAEVGDDVYQEDPTVNRLERISAEMLGKEAALFVSSGTMGNLIPLILHCQRGDEAIVGKNSHIFVDEVAGAAALAGVQLNTLANQPDGTLRLEEIRAAIRAVDIHCPKTSLVAIENTHAERGGVPLTLEYTRQVGALAKERGLKMHLDGARIFNAAVALGVSAKDLAAPADSVTFCLSKGLCAPAGSMLCGSADFIARARKVRKQLGGGMRQIGILAAAGIVALEENIERLAEDHLRMRQLAAGLAAIPGLRIDSEYPPSTNMLFVSLEDEVPIDAETLYVRLAEKDVLCMVYGARQVRLVTHYWINDEDVDAAVRAFREVLAAV